MLMEIDLNLLRVFDTLMELRSVTRAADRLGLTQSAVSHALGRLRQALDDPLFVRGAQGLQPTARAAEMAGGVREGLRRISQTLAPAHFTARDNGRRFSLAAGTYFCMLLIPALVEHMRIEAPAVSLRIVPVSDQLVAALDRGDVDLAFGTFARAPGRFVIEPLFEDEMVWIAARGSAEARRPFDAARVAALPRVSIVARGPFDASPPGGGDERLIGGYADAAAGLEETTIVYDSYTAVTLVAATDMVAIVPRRLAERSADSVVALGPGGERSLQIAMLWHARHRADPAFEWLRGVIRGLV
ncbi:LysR family transcriptional regulator [Sphingomonas sp. CGMCC 1.13654]|uniref:LysR family transcriptional regulator n=1 Tax=Sphingomonas chungangi TaxID=2683589 RepID=A0A838L0Z3_9SPHN|nr:LysR family transcriptional regulator [Sphingomonas chungangi]MBA2932610.1 LysR family transcriptional regulator [Sphingomonas chungangi]MVW56233.1 LysR family transcriptional regulator [Sphingomonas chungangi]